MIYAASTPGGKNISAINWICGKVTKTMTRLAVSDNYLEKRNYPLSCYANYPVYAVFLLTVAWHKYCGSIYKKIGAERKTCVFLQGC